MARARWRRRWFRLGSRALPLLLVPMMLLTAVGLGEAQKQHSILVGDDPAADGVLVVEAPWYNAFLVQRHTDEPQPPRIVEVAAEVDETGEVVATSVLAHPNLPLLPRWAEEAARDWRFAPSDSGQTRQVTLRFSFEGAISEAKPRGTLVRYESPLTLHVQYIEPTVLFLPRVDGEMPEQTCEIHHVVMSVELVPISYGLPSASDPESPEVEAHLRWVRAREQHFPNAPSAVGGSCIVGSETSAEVYVCPQCKAARDQCLQQHVSNTPSG